MCSECMLTVHYSGTSQASCVELIICSSAKHKTQTVTLALMSSKSPKLKVKELDHQPLTHISLKACQNYAAGTKG